MPKDASTSPKVVEISTIEGTTEREFQPSDFEAAISATKLGKFNLLLFLLTIPAGWGSVFQTTTMSYVFPAAQCDLNLSLNEKGSLNAITFLGMVSSGFVWGFLCDTLGRKKLIVIGFLLDAFFVILSSFSQSYAFLITTKFFGGLIINGPFAALTSYLSEFHSAKYRTRVQLVRGLIICVANIILPLLAWVILPQKFNLFLLNGSIVLHSWNFFLLICALPSLIGGVFFIFMPESPKFLMTVGRNKEALMVFKKVYCLNTGQPADTFPIKSLVEETKMEKNDGSRHGGHVTANRTASQALKEGFQQIKPLCFPPHISYAILVCSIQSLIMISVNTLRLWLPQIFQSMSDYQLDNEGETASLCTMLEMLRPQNESHTCAFNFAPSVYINGMIIAGVALCGHISAILLVNKLGKKLLLTSLAVVSGGFAMSIYFTQDSIAMLAVSAIFISLGSICGNVVVSIVIDLFPTTLRTVTISIVMMMGRTSSMAGNLVFPLLLKLGCAPPFISIGSATLAYAFLTIFLPNTELKALE